MLWDAGFDQNNIINGKTYSDNIVEIMKSGGVRPTGKPNTLPPGTQPPSPETQPPPPMTTQPPVPPVTTQPPVPPTKPSKF